MPQTSCANAVAIKSKPLSSFHGLLNRTHVATEAKEQKKKQTEKRKEKDKM
jgi:hypothetical protein